MIIYLSDVGRAGLALQFISTPERARAEHPTPRSRKLAYKTRIGKELIGCRTSEKYTNIPCVASKTTTYKNQRHSIGLAHQRA